MPLRIERENLWRRLATRFKARTAGEEDEPYPVILETLQPTTNFDTLAIESKAIKEALLSVTGTGAKLIQTVPDGKRWTILHVVAYLVTGTWTFDRIEVRDLSEGSTQAFDIQAAGVTILESTLLGCRLPLEEGDQIGIGVDAYTGTGNAGMILWVLEEDAF